MADTPKTRTVTLLTPTGAVDFVVGSDWSRDQIERAARTKRPELFAKSNVAKPDTNMSTVGFPSVISGLVKTADAASRSWREESQAGRNLGTRKGLHEQIKSDLPRYAAAAEMGGGGGGVAKGVAKDVGEALERRAATKLAGQSAEAQARKLTQAINPAESEWRSMMRNLLQENVTSAKEFAEKTGNKLRTNLDLSKAAKGAAEEFQSFYKKRILDPIKDEIMEIPRESQVARIPTEGGTSSRATIGAVDGRITQINDQLRSNYVKRQSGQVREALANDSELTAERNALADRLYQEIGNKLKINPQAIRALRQKFGSLFSLADQIEGAVTRRESVAASRAEGRSLPHSVTQLAMRGINKLRGGPSGIADRAVARILQRTTL